MSRDLTPRELLGLEQYNMRNSPDYSLFAFMRNTTVSHNGVTRPLHSAEEMDLREQYPMLGKLYDRFDLLHAELSKIPGGLPFLKQKDQELANYIATGVGDKGSSLIAWFEGKLDEHFYYSERNNELFLNAMASEARAAFLAAPRVAEATGHVGVFRMEDIDVARLTERSNARLCFDTINGPKNVCIDLSYGHLEGASSVDTKCIYFAPAEPANIRKAQDILHLLAEKFHIPAYDECAVSLIQYPVKVSWVNLGEGIRGDYDPKDPDDVNLLRFDVHVCRNGVWEPESDGSHCTCFPAEASAAQQEQALHILMNKFHPIVSNDIEASIRKASERMSYIGIDFFCPSPEPEKSPARKPALSNQITSAQSRTEAGHCDNTGKAHSPEPDHTK